MFTFAYYPVLLLLILVAAWAFVRFRKGNPAVTFSLAHKLTKMSSDKKWLSKLPLILRTTALVLLVIAAARPQMYNAARNTKSSGVDIMLCIDASGTMAALDFELEGKRASRLAAVQKVVSDFINKREYDRIGLVVFGTDAYTQAPLTMDKGLLLNLVGKLEVGMAGDTTAIGSAIAISGKRLKELKAKSKILIVLTDGRNNAGEITPTEATEAVKQFGVKIYTIGVGGRGPAPMPQRTPFGVQMTYQNIDLDEDSLQQIATAGNGRYFRASDTKQLEEVYDIIDKAEKTDINVKEFFHFRELYLFFLIPCLLMLLAEIVIKATILRTIP